jgi:hypothetical protein
MNRLAVCGYGAVSPAGWGVDPLREALAKDQIIAPRDLARPGWSHGLLTRQVPAPPSRPPFLAHARFRRTSPISQYALWSALEALGPDAEPVRAGKIRLGIVLCVMTGCVNYSRRFYDETLKDPATASPLVFPETVFNAPASHIAAFLGTRAVNYTLVGDPGMFLQGLALGARWLADRQIDGCLVLGAEELDWLTADAARLFEPRMVASCGSGALYLKRDTEAAVAHLAAITDAWTFTGSASRIEAMSRMRGQLPPGQAQELLCDSTQRLEKLDQAEQLAWKNWPGTRLSPKAILGEGFAAGSAWQCVAAVDSVRQQSCPAAHVSVSGINQQAIGARFEHS